MFYIYWNNGSLEEKCDYKNDVVSFKRTFLQSWIVIDFSRLFQVTSTAKCELTILEFNWIDLKHFEDWKKKKLKTCHQMSTCPHYHKKGLSRSWISQEQMCKNEKCSHKVCKSSLCHCRICEVAVILMVASNLLLKWRGQICQILYLAQYSLKTSMQVSSIGH